MRKKGYKKDKANKKIMLNLISLEKLRILLFLLLLSRKQ